MKESKLMVEFEEEFKSEYRQAFLAHGVHEYALFGLRFGLSYAAKVVADFQRCDHSVNEYCCAEERAKQLEELGREIR